MSDPRNDINIDINNSLAASDQTEEMAHQLNTDYLRRKLLNPQRQVSFIPRPITLAAAAAAAHSFLPSLLSLPRSPFVHSSLFSSVITSILPPELGLLASTLSFAVAIHNTARTTLLAFFSVLHVISLVEFVGSCRSRASGASVDHLAPELPFQTSKPASRTKIFYSQHHFTHSHTNTIPSPSLLSPTTPLLCSTRTLPSLSPVLLLSQRSHAQCTSHICEP